MNYKSLLKGIPALLILIGLQLPAMKCFSQTNSPEVIYKLGDGEGSLVRLPDGNLMLFKMEGRNLVSMVSTDGRIWSKPKVEVENDRFGAGLVLTVR